MRPSDLKVCAHLPRWKSPSSSGPWPPALSADLRPCDARGPRVPRHPLEVVEDGELLHLDRLAVSPVAPLERRVHRMPLVLDVVGQLEPARKVLLLIARGRIRAAVAVVRVRVPHVDPAAVDV